MLHGTGPAAERPLWLHGIRRAGAWLCVLALAFYSLTPPHLKEAAGGEPGTPGQLNHAFAYFVTAIALRCAYPGSTPLRTVLLLVAYGCVLELLQTLVPERSPKAIDAVSSGLGAVLGALVSLPLLPFLACQVRRHRRSYGQGSV